MEKHKDITKILFSQEDISQIIQKIADDINRDYKEKFPALVCLLKGGMHFLSELGFLLKMDVTYHFMEVSSYKGSETSGVVRITKDLRESIEDRDVIIVEDILDTGITLNYITKILTARNPNSMKICVLLDKPSKRIIPIEIDYMGAEIEDNFVVGHGLDFNEKYRNLPYIGILKKELYE